MRCGCCGSLSSLPIPSSELIERFYAQSYDFRWFADHLTGKRRDAAERVTELAPLLGPRVLDLGGGLGYLTEALRKRGFDASRYDLFADRAAVKPTPGSFDAVVCLHVLEHTRDSWSTLATLGAHSRLVGLLA
jgi:2-polyprenyl-3-methyl-5-hydroxy-6-metoxy-1,4-benzoquinol methylase